MIADKFVASFDEKANAENTQTQTAENIETATASLETDDDDDDIRSFMHKLLSK